MYLAGNMVSRARFLMAGVLGFEPRVPDSESGALPLGDTPK